MISDAVLLIKLDLSSESMLDKLLFLDRIEGLSKAVLGSPFIKNNDDGDEVGVSSYSPSANPSRKLVSTVFRGADNILDWISFIHLSKQ